MQQQHEHRQKEGNGQIRARIGQIDVATVKTLPGGRQRLVRLPADGVVNVAGDEGPVVELLILAAVVLSRPRRAVRQRQILADVGQIPDQALAGPIGHRLEEIALGRVDRPDHDQHGQQRRAENGQSAQHGAAERPGGRMSPSPGALARACHAHIVAISEGKHKTDCRLSLRERRHSTSAGYVSELSERPGQIADQVAGHERCLAQLFGRQVAGAGRGDGRPAGRRRTAPGAGRPRRSPAR